MIRLVSAGVFIGFGLLGAGAVLPTWLSGAATVVLFGLAVARWGRRNAVPPAPSHGQTTRRRGRAVPAPPAVSQLLFAGLLIVGWIASLGLVAPLDAIDHWVGFALLAGLGWKLIHRP